jgi:hypothetical protein
VLAILRATRTPPGYNRLDGYHIAILKGDFTRTPASPYCLSYQLAIS